LKNIKFVFHKSEEVDFAGRIILCCSELNSKAMIQGLNNFVVDVSN
jgi:hypothetical protein